MSVATLFRNLCLAAMTLSSIGCSTLGLSCFTGHYLTDQTESVLNATPRHPQVARELDQEVLRTHYLQPGDVLLIETVDLNSDIRLPADQRVLVDGSIDLGGFGRVIVAGLTIEATEELIQQTIMAAGQPRTAINVRLLEPVHRYYVLGEVSSPGSYPLGGHESVLDGILAAGGLTSTASQCNILLARPTQPHSCRVTLPVCYREITQLGDTSTNYQLQPGDRIFVASRSWCEEFKFWKANESCPRCQDCQWACPDPESLQPTNPLSRLVADSPAVGETGELEVESETLRESQSVVEPPAEPSAPESLPDAVDGELDFDEASNDRFEPLWITPS